jgi:acetolactate synthase I/II/III large subunit
VQVQQQPPAVKQEPPITGAYALLDSIKRHGVEHIFGYPGGAILPIYDELYKFEERGDLKHFLVRHEQGAVHAADGYARATGRVGVCFATSGPGATNLVTGIATAHMDSIPMVIITGQVPRHLIGTDGFQETDIWGITLPIVKHSYVVRDAKEVARVIAEAFYIASTGRPGPVLVDIPKDVGNEVIADYKPVAPGAVRLPGYRPTVKGNPRQISQALGLIRSAKRPLLYVGGGTIASNAQAEVLRLAEQYQIPVTTTLMGIGAFDEHHDLGLGMLGMHGTAYANFAVTECDLLIAVGARFDDRVTGKLDAFAAGAKVIHIDVDPAEVAKVRQPDVPIVGDVKEVLRDLLQRTGDHPPIAGETSSWLSRIARWKEDYPLQVPTYDDVISPQEVIVEVGRQAPTAYYSTDVGQHQMWSAQFLKNGPRRWISSAGLGTMGFGMPAAMGAKVAVGDAEQVICISGDASIQMNIQELGTLRQYNIAAKVVIVNNGWQGMVRQWQQAFHGERYSSSHMAPSMPDFVKLAEAYGVKGMIVTRKEDLSSAIAAMLAHDGPVLLDVHVRKDENCYPMVAPGKANSEMVGLPQHKQLQRAIALLVCPSCGKENEQTHRFCSDCGTALS